MTRKPKVARDNIARDIYERAMLPYWSLMAEADRKRLLEQIPVSGRPRRSRLRVFLTAIGSGMVILGTKMQKAGERGS